MTKTKINITTKNATVELQIFDALYAFLQNLDSTNYKSIFDITIDSAYSSEDLNILCDYMPAKYSEHDLTKYDLIFYSNGNEPLTVATSTMSKLLERSNVYLISNSYLTNSHALSHKVLWFPFSIQMCRDYWTRRFYPQYFENIKNEKINRNNNLIAINGSIRTNRYYFSNLLELQEPTIQQCSNIGKTIHKLNDAHWESDQDTKFREWLNIEFIDISQPEPDHYYDRSPVIGMNGKFGKISPGYFIMPEYFKYSCVIFPESTWQNDELAITEKALKCFYAGSLPFPIGGSNINQLYNDIGFYTAWNLLPEKFKQFDKIKDHKTRYQLAVDAITWLNNNRSIFETDEFIKITTENKFNFFKYKSDITVVDKLFNLIKTKLSLDIF